jgi:hypothetical protein
MNKINFKRWSGRLTNLVSFDERERETKTKKNKVIFEKNKRLHS